jgi:hypothetical protein
MIITAGQDNMFNEGKQNYVICFASACRYIIYSLNCISFIFFIKLYSIHIMILMSFLIERTLNSHQVKDFWIFFSIM